MVAESLVYQLHQKPVMFNKMRTRVWKTERMLALERGDALKMKTAVLMRLYGRLHQRSAVCIRCPRDLEVLPKVQSSPLVEPPVEPRKGGRLILRASRRSNASLLSVFQACVLIMLNMMGFWCS